MRSNDFRVRFPGNCEPNLDHEAHFFRLIEEQTGRQVFSYWSERSADHAPALVHTADPETGELIWENDLRRVGGTALVRTIWYEARQLAEENSVHLLPSPAEMSTEIGTIGVSDRISLPEAS